MAAQISQFSNCIQRKMIKSFSEQIRRISHVKRCAAQTTTRDEGAVAPRAGSPSMRD
jgi:hypothetical protein